MTPAPTTTTRLTRAASRRAYLRKPHQHVGHRHLAPPWSRARAVASRGERATAADQLERLMEVGNSFAAERGIPVGEVEVEMRPGGIAAVADQAQDLAGPDPVAQLDPEGAGLQVSIEGVAPPAQVEDDVIPAHGLEGDRHRARIHPRNILGNSVLGGYYGAFAHRQRILPVGVIAGILEPVAGEGEVVVPDSHVVDGKPLRDRRRSSDRDQGASMSRFRRRSVTG